MMTTMERENSQSTQQKHPRERHLLRPGCMQPPHKWHGHGQNQKARHDIQRRHGTEQHALDRTRSIGNALVPVIRDGVALEDGSKKNAGSMRQDQRRDYVGEDLEAAHGEDPCVENEDRDFGGRYRDGEVEDSDGVEALL